MRDENSHAGVKSKAQATHVRAFDAIPRLRKPTDAGTSEIDQSNECVCLALWRRYQRDSAAAHHGG